MTELKFVTKEFKERAAQLYLEGGKSYETLIEDLEIKDAKTLRAWGRTYQPGESLDEGREKKAAEQGPAAKEQKIKIKIKCLDFAVPGLYLLFVN